MNSLKKINGTYKNDCEFLLKDLTGILKEITIEEKENLIRQGISYSNFISKEEPVNENIEKLFLDLVETNAKKIAEYVGIIAQKIYKAKNENLVLVSLARAGTPYGILIKKYLEFKYAIEVKHYSISIIRGRGIDFNALRYILENNLECDIQFVDGWTGKGSIITELEKSIRYFNEKYKTNIDSELAVIADPARLCNLYGTRDDIIIPNCVLNATVSGLISRTILNEKYILKDDFHGAILIEYLKDKDYSNYYIDKISQYFSDNEFIMEFLEPERNYSKYIVKEIQKMYLIDDINKIKLSVGEASRVLIRRNAKILLVRDINDENIKILKSLANLKNIKIKEYKNLKYNAAAIID
ncbi:MAG: cysteine protease StiP domain-containing protein [Sarcina sp.]